jgi:prophage regulatory protein
MQTTFEPSTGRQVLRAADVARVTGLHRVTIYRRMARGLFPKPIRLGPNSVGWLRDEIDDWFVARIAEREKANTG